MIKAIKETFLMRDNYIWLLRGWLMCCFLVTVFYVIPITIREKNKKRQVCEPFKNVTGIELICECKKEERDCNNCIYTKAKTYEEIERNMKNG